MKISLEKALTSAVVGAVDLIGESYLKDKKVGPLDGEDALRIAMTAGSFLVNYFDYEREYSETVFYASLPLFMKTVKKLVTSATASPKIEVKRVEVKPVETVPTPTPTPTPTPSIPP